MTPKLVIIRGLPGSGKSTTAQRFVHDGYKHYEADMYFERNGTYQFNPSELGDAHLWCQTQTELDLSIGKPVVVSNTFTTFKEVLPYLDMISSFNDLHIITCTDQFGSIHNVPQATLDRMASRMQSHRYFEAQCICHFGN